MTKSSHHQSPPDVDIEPRPLPRSTVWLMAVTVGVIVANIYYAQPLSTWDLVVRHSTLRESSILGALFFAAFSAFWTTLVFFLQSPSYHYGSAAAVAGMFGLVGAAGAFCAPGIGHLAHKHGPRFTIRIALWVALLSFAFMALAGKHLAGLIIGVVLMDLGVQSGHVSNQTRIYGIDPNARSGLSMVCMVCYFVGGGLGSWLGALCWHFGGWLGVCSFGVAILTIAIAVEWIYRRDESNRLNVLAAAGTYARRGDCRGNSKSLGRQSHLWVR